MVANLVVVKTVDVNIKVVSYYGLIFNY